MGAWTLSLMLLAAFALAAVGLTIGHVVEDCRDRLAPASPVARPLRADRNAVLVTCLRDGRMHRVDDAAILEGQASDSGHFRAQCGHVIAAAALAEPPGPDCLGCATQLVEHARRPRRRRRAPRAPRQRLFGRQVQARHQTAAGPRHVSLDSPGLAAPHSHGLARTRRPRGPAHGDGARTARASVAGPAWRTPVGGSS